MGLMEREAEKHEIEGGEARSVLGRVLDETFGKVAAQARTAELDHRDCAVRGLCVAIQVFTYDIERLWRQIWKGMP